MDIKQVDLIKILKWCGYKHLLLVDGAHKKHYWWESPDREKFLGFDPPQLTLDNLYQYAIPKLQDKGYIISLLAYEQKGFKASIGNVIHDDIQIKFESDNPTEALYKAIMAVINKENKK